MNESIGAFIMSLIVVRYLVVIALGLGIATALQYLSPSYIHNPYAITSH